MAKYQPGSSVKYGTGSYDSQAHKGVGKDQKALGGSAGQGNAGSTPHTNSAPVRDGISGKAPAKRGYQLDAHSTAHHGQSGQAIGLKDDLRPNSYDSTLFSESERGNVPHVDGYKAHGSRSARAEHHPAPSREPHTFGEKAMVAEAHGYGHAAENRSGALRMSGHSRGHQVGKRK